MYQEGFVEREPFRGAIVSRIRTQDVRELFELREYLEPIAVRDAVETLSDEEIREIEGLVKEGEQAYQSGDYDKASDYIRLFHDRLIWKVKNTRIRDILTNLDDHLDRIRHISIRISGLPARTFTDHKKIVEALRRRNAEQAEALVRDHVRLILEVFLSEDASNRLSWFSVGEQDILQTGRRSQDPTRQRPPDRDAYNHGQWGGHPLRRILREGTVQGHRQSHQV